jgi:hypothetical protein
MCDATILGKKQKVSQGREKLKEMYQPICAVHDDIELLKRQLGEQQIT